MEASDWSWTPLFLDVDLDGYEDLLISNGQARDFQNVDMERRRQKAVADGRIQSVEDYRAFIRQYPPLRTANAAWRNRGDLTFEETSRAWGFDRQGISQGMAVADLDNDGDLDVVINNLNAEAGILRNDSPAPRLAVRLAGLAPNRWRLRDGLRAGAGRLSDPGKKSLRHRKETA